MIIGTKCELILVDRSGYTVQIHIWGKNAKDHIADDNPTPPFIIVKVINFEAIGS